MPGIHSAMSRHLFTLNGNVKTSGGAKHLAKGQFTIVKSRKPTPQGAEIVTSFSGLPKDEVLEMRMGKHSGPNTRTAVNNKPYASENFTMNSVVSVKSNFPKSTEQKFDEVIVGYDGVNAKTAITLEEGQTTVINIVLTGPHVEFITGKDQYVFTKHFGREIGQTNQEVINDVVEQLKKAELPQEVALTDLVKISTVDSSKEALAGTEYKFSSITLTDTGDSNALGEIQSQYEYDIKVTGRKGYQTTYTAMHLESETLPAFIQTVPSYIKGCEDCMDGYEEVEEGVVYSITVEDDGEDVKASFSTIPGIVGAKSVKIGNDDGVGVYSVIVAEELTSAQITTFVEGAAPSNTARFNFIGEVKAVCSDDSETSTPWVKGDSCFASTEDYIIQLRDDECDGSVLEDLQEAYPELTIEVSPGQANARSQKVTLTGSSGTANINVKGDNYVATHATSLSATAAAFVSTHGTALASNGVTVTSSGAALTFVIDGATAPAVTIVNTATNLSGTVGAATDVLSNVEGGCQTVYVTTVATNIVCEECDDIFLDTFTGEAPEAYNFTEWEKVETESDESALMGIRLTGLPFVMTPTESTRDVIPFYETSTRISVSGGYAETTSTSFDPIYNENFSVKKTSRAEDRDNLGAHIMGWEDASKYYFDGTKRHKGNQFAKAVYGEESVLKFDSQYCSYEITVHDTRPSQGVGRHSDMSTTYIVWAEVGEHIALEAYVNKLAAAAGLATTQAVAK